MNSTTITLSLPPAALSPNGRGHWSRIAQAKKAYRLEAWAKCVEATKGQMPSNWKRAAVKIRAFFPTLRHPDPDNLIAMMKAAFDGIADAQVIQNDKDLWPERPEISKDATNPRIELTITEEP